MKKIKVVEADYGEGFEMKVNETLEELDSRVVSVDFFSGGRIKGVEGSAYSAGLLRAVILYEDE